MYFHVKKLAVDGDASCGSVTDNPAPVFSWTAERSEDAGYQSAYRLTVRTETKQKWDSG